jgi:hypothetical protein
MAEKTDAQRVREIYKLTKEHFGDIRCVTVGYERKIGWIAEVKFNDDFQDLNVEASSSTQALRKLKNRVKKIIKRYNEV